MTDRIHNEAIAALNVLIEDASMRLRDVDCNSIEWQRFNVELETYGRVLDMMLQLSEKHSRGFQTVQLLAAVNN
jgi:hypothetical protein